MDKKELEKAIEKTVLKMALDPKNALDNQYEKVISVYESLLEIDPKDMQALLNIGSIWFYSKEYRKALKYFNEAMVVNPSNYLVYYNLGNTYAELKNFPKALRYYSRTLDFNSQEPEVYNAIALLYHDFDDFVEARAYYEKSLSLDPNNLTALVDLGNVCYKLYDYNLYKLNDTYMYHKYFLPVCSF